MSLIVVGKRNIKSHKATVLDIKADLRRAIMSSFSKKGFEDANTIIFLKNAEKNLKEVKMDKDIYIQVTKRLKKAKDTKKSIENRREDVLTASSLIF